MKFTITPEWLKRRLERAEDSAAVACGTSLEELTQAARRRTVTPGVLAQIPSEVGKVVRYIREERGWTRAQLAEIADVDEAEIVGMETVVDYFVSPRAVMHLAVALGLSKSKLQEVAGHVTKRAPAARSEAVTPAYAAHSKPGEAMSEDELDTIRALVAVLSEKAPG